jgi:hypothetical protein
MQHLAGRDDREVSRTSHSVAVVDVAGTEVNRSEAYCLVAGWPVAVCALRQMCHLRVTFSQNFTNYEQHLHRGH